MSPLIVAVEMGYGHLRPAAALAATLGVPLDRADRPPLASPGEARAWALALAAYTRASRWSQVPVAGLPFRWGIDAMTAIHGEPDAPRPAADAGCLATAAAVRSGLGAGLVAHLRTSGAPLVTTFYLPALCADAAGLPAWCVVTDTDCARAWAPVDAARSRIRYCAPTERVRARLRSYGVPDAHIRVTGFPLPPALTTAAPATHVDRLARLSGHAAPPRLVMSIGGAGAQAAQVRAALPGLRALVAADRLHLTLAVGTHRPLAEELAPLVGPGIALVTADTVEAYLPAFDAALAEADLLWTKPSELVFYGALGLPLLLAPPIGAQEHANLAHVRGVAIDAGASLPATIDAGLRDGSLARAADAAWAALPRDGADRIAAWVREG